MIEGHQKQWQFLKRSFFAGRLSHSFLFSGPAELGKKTMALEFVKLLHCQEKDFEKRPCNLCSTCKAVSKETHPDALFLTLKEQTEEIQISQIRDLIYRLSLKPFLSTFKTAIIDRAHLMNSEAQNCLLKTLEEPKGNAVLFLITPHPEVLSETIRSRTQEIKFFPIPKADILNFLKAQGMAEQNARLVAQISLGRIGKAIEFLMNPEKIESEKKKGFQLAKILKSDIGVRFQYAKEFAKEPLGELFETWLRYLREYLLFKTGNFSKSDVLILGDYSLPDTKRIIQALERIRFLVSTRNLNKRLALEILMLKI